MPEILVLPMQKFEYAILHISQISFQNAHIINREPQLATPQHPEFKFLEGWRGKSYLELLNKLGQEGWEMVVPMASQNINEVGLYFKRPLD